MINIIIARISISYLLCATILFFNLQFNPNIEWELVDKKTKERQKVPSFYTILFCIYWIIFIPVILIQRKKYSDKGE